MGRENWSEWGGSIGASGEAVLEGVGREYVSEWGGSMGVSGEGVWE